MRLGLHRTNQSQHAGVGGIRCTRRYPTSVPDEFSKTADHLADLIIAITGQHTDCTRQMLGEPGIGGELYAVGDFVKAYPQPKVLRHQSKLTFDGDHIWIDQKQAAAVITGERVVLTKDAG